MDHRYSRQMLFAPIGEQGQQKLKQSSVFIVGMGALGTVLANHMVRAGVGNVRFIDRDFVEESNLQRQLLFTETDVEDHLPKAVAAERRLKQINSSLIIEGIVGDLNAANISDVIKQPDLILDGTDNFQTRFLINDYSVRQKIPYVYGGAVGSRGMQATFIPGRTPCLRCLFEEAGGATETCDTSGVIAPVVDIIASYQAVEAFKLLVGDSDRIRDGLLSVDLWHGYQHTLKWGEPKTDCPTCAKREFPSLRVANEDQFTSLCGRETIQITPQGVKQRDLAAWKERLANVGEVEINPFLLRCRVEGKTLVLFQDGRVMVQGTDDVVEAKNMYAKYIGM